MKGALSRLSDKLAISGVADKVRSFIEGSHIAELWIRDFEDQLM